MKTYCDLFGVSSIEEVSGRIARSIYVVTRTNDTLFQRDIRFITSFRPVLSSSPDGGVSVSVQPAYTADAMDLVDATTATLEKSVVDVSNGSDAPPHTANFEESSNYRKWQGILYLKGRC